MIPFKIDFFESIIIFVDFRDYFYQRHIMIKDRKQTVFENNPINAAKTKIILKSEVYEQDKKIKCAHFYYYMYCTKNDCVFKFDKNYFNKLKNGWINYIFMLTNLN